MKILCLGGSVTRGVRTSRSWPEHLWGMIIDDIVADGASVSEAVRSAVVVNGGKPRTQIPMINRLAPADWSEVRFDHVVIQIGPEDTRGGGLTPREFALCLRQLIGFAQAITPQHFTDSSAVGVCTPYPVGDTKLRGYNRNARRWAKRVSPVVADVCMEASAQMIPLADMKNSMLYDGVHPNREGYSWIASRVYEEMAL